MHPIRLLVRRRLARTGQEKPITAGKLGREAIVKITAVRICLIQVPYHAGDDRAGSAKGPRRFLEAGVDRLLAARGLTIRVEEVVRSAPFRDTASASLAVCGQLAGFVRQAVIAGEVPLVLAGGCDASKGVLSGFDHASSGVVWFDAHADFNTVDSTITGYFPGMSMAVITGHCYRKYWAQIGNSAPIPEAAVLMLGVRDVDSAEQERLQSSAIEVVRWQAGLPQVAVGSLLDQLANRVKEVYLHIDMDALDPLVAPGVVDQPVPGGLTLEQLEDCLHSMSERLRIRAATLATYNPDRDQNDRTLRAGLRILEFIGGCLNKQG